jgi:DNA-binding protein H-NS
MDKKMKQLLKAQKWMTMASDTLSVVEKQVASTTSDRDSTVAEIAHIEKDKEIIQRKIRRDKIMVKLTKLKLTLGNLEMEHSQVGAQKEGLENAKNNLEQTKADLEKHLNILQSQALALGVKSAASLAVEAREEVANDVPEEK